MFCNFTRNMTDLRMLENSFCKFGLVSMNLRIIVLLLYPLVHLFLTVHNWLWLSCINRLYFRLNILFSNHLFFKPLLIKKGCTLQSNYTLVWKRKSSIQINYLTSFQDQPGLPFLAQLSKSSLNKRFKFWPFKNICDPTLRMYRL